MGHGCSICSTHDVLRKGGPLSPRRGKRPSQQERSQQQPSYNIKKFDNQQNDLETFHPTEEPRQPNILYRNLFDPNPKITLTPVAIHNYSRPDPSPKSAPTNAKVASQSVSRPVPVGCEDDKVSTKSPIKAETPRETPENDRNAAGKPESVSNVGDATGHVQDDTVNQEIIDQYFASESRRESVYPGPRPNSSNSSRPPHPSPCETEPVVEPRNSFLLKAGADNLVDNVIARVMVAQAEIHQFDSVKSFSSSNNEKPQVEAQGTDSLYSTTSSSSFIKEVLDQINAGDKSVFQTSAAEPSNYRDSENAGGSNADAETGASATCQNNCTDTDDQTSETEIIFKVNEKNEIVPSQAALLESQPSEKLPLDSEITESQGQGNQEREGLEEHQPPKDASDANSTYVVDPDSIISDAPSNGCSASSSVVDLHVKDMVYETLGKVVSDLSSCSLAEYVATLSSDATLTTEDCTALDQSSDQN